MSNTATPSARAGPTSDGVIGKRLVFLLVNVVIALAIVEIVIVSALHAPSVLRASPKPFRQLIQQVYRHFNRGLIQFDVSCARYDPAITYTLKPGECTFENLEFRTAVHVNHVGVRDDEAALAAPEVIVVGDSHAMGWGVQQEETLGRVLARKSGLKTLNAAVSSYGTVREMGMLDRLDTSRLKVLIVQYTDNDVLENWTFEQHHDTLPIMSQPDYDNIVRHYASQRRYYPGKYVYRLFMKVFRLEEPEPDQYKMAPVTPDEEARLFLHALTRAGHTRLDDVQVIVFEVNEQLAPPRPFITALESAKRRDGNPPFVRRLLTLDTTRKLTSRDFYTLDDHMNAHGHEVVGEALADLIRTGTEK